MEGNDCVIFYMKNNNTIEAYDSYTYAMVK